MTNYMECEWIYNDISLEELYKDERANHLNPIILRILKNRGIDTPYKIERFLHGGMKDLHDPRKMKDIEKAADLLIYAIREGLAIVVYGDYDTDGVTSTATSVELLRKAGANVEYFTNDRFKHGYGICPKGIDDMLKLFPDTKVIMTVDNGIMAFEGIRYAKEKGLMVIVTDHHEPGETLPEADAVVDPKRKDDLYPFKGLCGAGVAFKVMLLLYWKLNLPLTYVYNTLDIVALGTVADIVPLVDENRIIVQKGIEKMEAESRYVFKALREETNISQINAHYTIGFIYGPMINAIGRIDGNPRRAIEMFLEQDEQKIRNIVKYLVSVNNIRKDLTNEQCLLAEEMVEKNGIKPVISVYHPDFHEGVIGLIASRLKEKYYRPVFVFTKNNSNDCLKGSGRGIPGLHLKEAMDTMSDLFVNYGGHALACGLSLKEKHLRDFEDSMTKLALKTLSKEDFKKKYLVDAILSPHEITIDLADELKELEPFGEGFPKPILAVKNFTVDRQYYMGKSSEHIKLFSGSLALIMWRNAELYRELGEPKEIKALGYPEINVFNNQVNVNFIVEEGNLRKDAS